MDLLGSKKFKAALAGLVAVVLKYFVPDLDEATINQVLFVLISYIIGQGIADHGKEAAKVKAQNS